jgi:cysteine sulfinate desulfinase/cysteine desulfurase-like protein
MPLADAKAVDVARRQVAAHRRQPERDRVHQRRERVQQPAIGTRAGRDRGDHIITAATEHKSVLDSFRSREEGRQ